MEKCDNTLKSDHVYLNKTNKLRQITPASHCVFTVVRKNTIFSSDNWCRAQTMPTDCLEQLVVVGERVDLPVYE